MLSLKYFSARFQGSHLFDESTTAAEDLAKRLRLLLDVAEAETGSEPTFAQIAAFFDVAPAFLAGSNDAETPAKVSAQLDLVRAMRAARVKSYAARTMGDISPNALRAISKFLDAEVAQRPPDETPPASGGN